MSNISTVYDNFIARLEVVLPNHTRHTNPYKTEENNEQHLRKGYGLAISSGENSDRHLACRLSVIRTFDLTITRIVRANEFNLSSKESTWKELFEDQKLVIEDVTKDPTLADSSSIANTRFVGDTGLEFIFPDKDNYIKLTSTFTVEYFEDL